MRPFGFRKGAFFMERSNVKGGEVMNKFLKLGLAAVLSAVALAGCSSGSDTESTEKPTEVLIGISPDPSVSQRG